MSPEAPTTSRPPRRRARRGEGDLLRAEILQAAKDLLAETGDEDAVSVRAVAQRVGVTTPSLYLHFADKAALIDAVCQDVFATLDREMEQAARAIDDPLLSLRERGVAYARFALANPEHYRIVMMSPPRDKHHGFAGTDLMSTQTFAHLVDAVRVCQDAGIYDAAASAEELGSTLWAAVHGAVALAIAKPHLTAGDALDMCRHVIEAVGVGLAVCARIPDGVDVPGTQLAAMLGPPAADPRAPR